MKTSMKFLAAIGIMMGYVTVSMAQAPVTTSVTANATVQTPLVVTQEQALQFGNVNNVVGQTKVVSYSGVASSSGGSVAQTGVQQGIGKIVRSGGTVVYKLIVPTSLTNSTSVLPIGSFTTAYSLATTGASKTAGASDPVANYTTVADGTDIIYVHIGATVTPSAATNIIGTHSGTVTLSAEYN